MQLRETRFASFSSYRGARQICMQACDFSRYSRNQKERSFLIGKDALFGQNHIMNLPYS